MNPTNESIGRAFEILRMVVDGRISGRISEWPQLKWACEEAVRELDRQAPGEWVMVPRDLTPQMMRTIQQQTAIGQYICSNWTSAYDLFRDLWRKVISVTYSAPQPPAQEQGDVGEHVLMLDMILTSYGDKPLTFTAEKAALKAAISSLTRAAGAEDARDSYDIGWIECTKWAKRDDLVSDMDSPAYREDRTRNLTALREQHQRAAIASQAQEGSNG